MTTKPKGRRPHFRDNPFRRRRAPNQRARYLNPRESKEHPSLYDAGGNRRFPEH